MALYIAFWLNRGKNLIWLLLAYCYPFMIGQKEGMKERRPHKVQRKLEEFTLFWYVSKRYVESRFIGMSCFLLIENSLNLIVFS